LGNGNGAEVTEASSGLKPIFEQSFLLGAHELDEQIENVIGVTFLDEYIEPTLAIVYADEPSWTGMLPLKKDNVKYIVVSLDIVKKTSTPIVHVKKLPYDIRAIFPLPTPIGGALLVGANHLVHIDSAGKTSGVSVNAYSKLVTAMTLRDESALDLQLEGARVAYVNGTDALLVLRSGELWNLQFTIEGRKVFGFSIERATTVGDIIVTNPTTFSALGERGVFLGSATGDSKLLTWVRGGRLAAGGKLAVSRGDDKAGDTADDLDDIYGDDDEHNGVAGTSDKKLEYGVADELVCYGPIHDICVGQRFGSNGYELVAATGVGHSSGLTILQNSINPLVSSSIEFGLASSADIETPGSARDKMDEDDTQQSLSDTAQDGEMENGESSLLTGAGQESTADPRIWTLCPMSAIETRDGDALHRYVVTYDGKRSSKLYKITNRMDDSTDLTDFMADVATVHVATAMGDLVVVHIHHDGMVLYDHEFAKIKHIKLPGVAKAADVVGSHIFVHFENGTFGLYLTKYGANGKPTFEKLKISAKLPKEILGGSLALSSILSRPVRKKRKRDSSEVSAEVTYAPICVVLAESGLVVSPSMFSLSAMLGC
jgi:hypothetical protein